MLLVLVMLLGGVAAGTRPAVAEDNGVGLKPLMGWSSWSFIRKNPTAAKIEAQADALVRNGLSGVGFQNVNIDDFWYQCPGGQGPVVDGYGRWATDPNAFPPSGSTNGIQVVADYVHGKGLKFGLYVTPGISKQAVAQNTPIEGTGYHAADIANTNGEINYNCGGMVGIDYTKPGAQEFVNSWAKEFASWGVDYVKIDGVGTWDVPDIQAWSAALRQTGRPIHLELSNGLALSSAATWRQYANGWRTGNDIECYCGPAGSSFPLTQWGQVQQRFGQVADWQPYGGPGGFNDYDSLEVGNAANTGLTAPERQSMMSLWSMAASPLILGSDLTNLDPADLSYLKNKAVLAVDQDGIDASRIVNNGDQQVYAKTESDGSVVIGLFNYSDISSQTVSVDLAGAGVGGATTATDLWSGADLGTISGSYTANLGPGAVRLIKTAPGAGTNRLRIAAEDYHNTIAGGAVIASCPACSDGQKVGYIGNGSANYVQFNDVSVSAAGTYTLTFAYLLSGSRSFAISVNGGPDQVVNLTGSSWSTPVTASVPIRLSAGTNTIRFHNDTAYAPDLDLITLAPGLRIEAEAASNTLAGAAVVASCPLCSGGQKVGWIGNGPGNYVTVNNVAVPAAGGYTLTFAYTLAGSRSFAISVNGGPDTVVNLTGSDWSTPVTASVPIQLSAGSNTIRFHNDTAYAPDLDVVAIG